jgi:heme oxygenase (mycobilin-producing)
VVLSAQYSQMGEISMKYITLIHPFKVDAQQEQVFLNAWKSVDQYMQKQKGFIETKLHRSLNIDGLTTFSFVNIAFWENVESFHAAIRNDDFTLMVSDVLKFSCGPGLYEDFNIPVGLQVKDADLLL